MTISELQEQIGNSAFFTFTTGHDRALVLTNLINNAGFSAVIFRDGSQSTVVTFNNLTAQAIVGRDIFPEVESATATFVEQVNHDLSVIPHDLDGTFYHHPQRMSMCLFAVTRGFFNKYGNLAFHYILEEDLEINKNILDEHRKGTIRQLLNTRH